MILILCSTWIPIIPKHVSATEVVSNYHENSGNNGTGYFRKNIAMLGISNLTHSTASAFGYQSKDETSIPIWQAYPNDKVLVQPAMKIASIGPDTIDNIVFTVKMSDMISIDKTRGIQVTNLTNGHNIGTSFIHFTDPSVSFDEENNVLVLELTPNDLGIPANFTGTTTFTISGVISNFVVGDRTEMPVNARSQLFSTNGEEYISGVTSKYISDMRVPASKTISNLSSPGSEEYWSGDEVNYSITASNKMTDSGTVISNVNINDQFPEGFEVTHGAMKVYNIDSKGIETDITNTPSVEIKQEDKKGLEVIVSEVKPAEHIRVDVPGIVRVPQTSTIVNTASISGIDNANGAPTEEVTCVSEVLVQNNPEKAEDVTVHYQDTEGTSLTEDVILSGNIGDTYNSEQKDIEGYTFKEVKGEASGTFTNQKQTVNYIYQKVIQNDPEPEKAEDVTVHYQDTEGTSLTEDVILSGNIGDTYNSEQKDIEGYTFKEVKGEASGTFTNQKQTVNYIYQKNKLTPEGVGSVSSSGSYSSSEKLAETKLKVQDLPKTGEKDELLDILVGVLILMVGVGLLFLAKLKCVK